MIRRENIVEFIDWVEGYCKYMPAGLHGSDMRGAKLKRAKVKIPGII